MVCERLRHIAKNKQTGSIINHLCSVCKEELVDEIYHFIHQLSDEFHLHLMDLLEIGNWGIDRKGNYKLLDYGCTYDLYTEIFEKVG